ncbi:MAG: threonine--tRNA ligase [Bacteroidota bacterium]|nr:threonine--tRNA ligase [Bacteroidota bacterium]
MITVQLPDKTKKEFPIGTTSLDVAKSISEGLARNVLAAEINGVICDANSYLKEGELLNLRLLTWNDSESKSVLWHSSAHLMAEALQFFYPGVKFTIGPSIENGFYYDVELPKNHSISTDDFNKIEKKILELASQKNKFIRKKISKIDAINYYKEKKNKYKLELIKDLEDGEITFYTQGEFTDLCKGPHIPNTGVIKAVKLLNVAGAYWRGDEKNTQLTRIYGISFPKKKELNEHLELLEEAKKRDHRKIGKEMELFTFSNKVGQGLPLWLPKGTIVREELIKFMRNLQLKHGYSSVVSPHIGNKELYVCSGHYDKYGEDSFQPIKSPSSKEEFFLKPMNCPHHCEIYKSSPKSYKDLPIRYAEFGTVYRYEQSGELHGLTRVRGFTQDDAHIFVTENQLESEFKKVIDIVLYILKILKFDNYTAQISLRDRENKNKYIGTEKNWDLAEDSIINAAKSKKLNTIIEYGEAAFYGPKLDFMVKDAIGRKWQLGTIQVDYNLPERFELEYMGADNKLHRPIMIHRAPFGSLERFLAILIEHTGGNFPLWLIPEQVVIIPISEKFTDYSNKILKLMKNYEIRAHIDVRSETIGKRIRDAEIKKIPYMVIIGEKELQEKNISVRKRGKEDLGSMSCVDFNNLIKKEINKEQEV